MTQDLAILTAVHGAFAVSENQFWMLGGDLPGEEQAKLAPAIVAELARFVRTWPTAPPEALWNTVRHGFAPTWDELSPETQYAFDIFATVLRHVDGVACKAAIAEEYKASLNLPPPPHDIEGTPLERTPGILDPIR
jgi:hypothetical protein